MAKPDKITIHSHCENNDQDCHITEDERRRRVRWEMKRVVEANVINKNVQDCCRRPRPFTGSDGLIKNNGIVQLMKSKDSGAAFFSNLTHCGNVWGCPICAPKITQRRKEELLKVKNQMAEKDLSAFMLTLTIPHNSYQRLGDLLKKFQRMLDKYFFNRMGWRAWKKHIGLIHTAKTLELTWGEANGWHPHIHLLLIVKNGFPIPEAKDMLREYQEACLAGGFSGVNEHGLTISANDSLCEYVSKWGFECELTMQNCKKGRDGRFSVFDLIRKFIETGDLLYIEKFKEFMKVFKGKRHIIFSRGFRRYFDLEKKSDKELAEENTKEAELIGNISPDQWRLILFHNVRREVLEESGRRGWQGVLEILDHIRGSYIQYRK
jgi:hypothetical protein